MLKAIIIVSLLIPSVRTNAQMVGTDSYIQGVAVEIGIRGIHGFEGVDMAVSPPPAGYHPRSAPNLFGFVANPQLNSWAGSAFDGDFFTPGSPENGWGIEIGTSGGLNGSNNCAGTWGTGMQNINGAITNWAQNFNCIESDWEGDMTSGTDLHVKINYLLTTTDLFYTTTVSITNNTALTIPDMYYYRNVDPDNNQEIGAGFTTTNTVASQPASGCNLAHVFATQSIPWNSYLGFAAVGSEWRATRGGFSNRDGSDIWYGVAGLSQVVGVPNTADEAISVAYRIQNLAPGQTETFKFVVILDNASATQAINNLTYLDYPGSIGAPPSICTPYVDTVPTCGGPVPITVSGPIVNDFTWSWSPPTGLSSTTGPSVTANPPTSTLYTVTGTPINPCFSPISTQVFVEVTPSTGANPYITPVAPICDNSPAFPLTVDSTGGTWLGTGITSPTLGTFDPAIAGAGTHLITYYTAGFCNTTDTMLITVLNAASADITQPATVCAGDPAFNLTSVASGGTWTGTGITSPSAGTFDPAVSGAGAFTITYNIPGTCPSQDTVIVTVGSVVTPVTGIAYVTPVCVSEPNPVPGTAPGFTPGGTYTATGGLPINAASGTINLTTATPGTYTVTYNVPGTVCGPSGTSTATITIDPLIIPNTAFSFISPVCANDTNAYPITGGTFTSGGTYSSTSGLVILDSTGMIDISASLPGTYTISYSVVGDTGLCTASGSGTANITINPLPVTAISPLDIIWIGTSTELYVGGGSSYVWTPMTGLTCMNANCDTVTAAPTETTEYCVRVTDGNGCVDTTCTKVVIEIPCPSNRNLVVPNAFTPNSDGVNDEICLSGWSDCVTNFEIFIYDRWGEKVFQSNDPDFCWDGTYKGKLLDPAVFVYFIKSTYYKAGDTIDSPLGVIDITKKGNISLVH